MPFQGELDADDNPESSTSTNCNLTEKLCSKAQSFSNLSHKLSTDCWKVLLWWFIMKEMIAAFKDKWNHYGV